MIISSFISILYLSMTMLNAPVNPNYEYGARVSSQQRLESLVVPTTVSGAYYLDTYVDLSADVSFNNDSNLLQYRAENFTFYFTMSLYEVASNGTRYSEKVFNVTYKPSFYITQSHTSDFDFDLEVQFRPEDDEVYYAVKEGADVILFDTYETDSGFNITSSATWNLDGSRFINTLQSVLTSDTTSYQAGYDAGVIDGIAEGQASVQVMDPQMFTIFNGILNVAMVPINVFLGIFNFEVYGINIASLVSSLLSIAILVIVIRLVVGSSAKGD